MKVAFSCFKISSPSQKFNYKMDTKKLTVAKSSANFLKVYLDLTFYLCICPFRVVYIYDHKKHCGHYIAKSYLAQKLLCIIFTSLGMFWLVRLTLHYRPSFHDTTRPSDYFEIVFSIADLLQKSMTIGMFWVFQQNSLSILNFIVDENNSLAPPHLTISKVGVALLYLPFTMIGMLGFASGRGLVRLDNSWWNLNSWWDAVKCTSQNIYFVQPMQGCDPSSTLLNTVFSVIGTIGLLYRLHIEFLPIQFINWASKSQRI